MQPINKITCFVLSMCLLLVSCATSTTAPALWHTEYGVVTGEHPAFKKDAMHCAEKVQNEKITVSNELTHVSALFDMVAGANTLSSVVPGQAVASFFNRIALCVESKGWRPSES